MERPPEQHPAPDQKGPFAPLETAPPQLPVEAGAVIAETIFGVGGSASPLDSERDLNLRIASSDGSRYLLKVSNPADDPLVLDMQTHAMLHITRQDPGLPVMRPLASLKGSYFEVVEGPGRARYLARLFTFLPGEMVEAAAMDRGALEAFGAMVARMGVALRGFFHPAGCYRILWDLKHTGELRRVLGDIEDQRSREVVARMLARFDGSVAPRLPGLRGQIIHNDLTLDNVLVDPSHRVSGIVDFGDLTHTSLICDLAVALVSTMWGRPDPFDAAEATVAGYRSVLQPERGEAELLADLVVARLLALVVIAAWRVRRYPENAPYITANVELAWSLLNSIQEAGAEEGRERLLAACMDGGSQLLPPNHRPRVPELLDRRRRVLGPALTPPTYDRPLYLVRGEGSRLFDRDGNVYLDAYNNVPVVGHSHPRVAQAIAQQSRVLNTNTRYLHESVIQLAERLVALMPEGLDTVMFVNSGSEANDVAWRFATTFTDSFGAIVTERAYHGVTTATLALSPEEWVTDHPEVQTIPAPDDFRGRYRRTEDGWAERYASHIGDALTTLREQGVGAAALYLDSLFTSDGIFSPPPAYLQEVVRRARAAGCLFVADEVQSGFGRTGTNLWSFAASGVLPDLVTLGKPMGNGHPVAAVVMRSEIAERLASKTDIFSTFGGNPVASRAALAVLDVLEEERLQERALEVGSRLRSHLEEAEREHSAIGDVRGAGLMLGVELVAEHDGLTPAPELTRSVMNRMREKGVLVGSTGRDENVLKIRPPLVFSLREADHVAEVLDASLRELASAGPGDIGDRTRL
jgi:4-aminobutyrate aminotransferase-like enzyme/Ser/Thr protein kinase RdoA (MazF antagonist)